MFFFAPVATVYGALSLVKLYQWIFKNTNARQLFLLTACVILSWEVYILFDFVKNPVFIGWCILITAICAALRVYEITKNRYSGRVLRTIGWMTLLIFFNLFDQLISPGWRICKIQFFNSKEHSTLCFNVVAGCFGMDEEKSAFKCRYRSQLGLR